MTVTATQDGLKSAGSMLPTGDAKQALPLAHFPARFQAVIWRNWSLVTPVRLARVLRTVPEVIHEEAARMGLQEPPASQEMEQGWLSRGYVTLIRQNWHLLPYPQLLDLLGWSDAKLAFTLKEDDFLWAKLGAQKPQVEEVVHHELNDTQRQATAWIQQVSLESQQNVDENVLEQPFSFIKQLGHQVPVAGSSIFSDAFGLRMIYSYFGLYGDPLLEPEADPFPDELLARLAKQGINGIWFQAVLYTLVPWLGDRQESAGHERRLDQLRNWVARAARHGIGVYPYLNEPRGMPASFFEDHPQWRGVHYKATGLHALCMSCDEIPRRLEAGVRELFTRVPDLAGVFTITMSENLTHCWSKPNGGSPCARCVDRPALELVAQVNNTIAKGVFAAKPDAKVIAWNWSWGKEWSAQVIDHLDPRLILMCTSETDLQTDCIGVPGRVVDYTMSKVGPGEYAKEHWRRARARKMQVMAKVQLNNTWECSAVPYLPVPTLVKKHLRQLQAQGVDHLMVSWTLGGYPGGNLSLVDHEPEAIALEQFGPTAAPTILKVWQELGDAFEHFPLDGSRTLYVGPQNYGPSNTLYLTPTGYRASMLGYCHDDLDSWRANHYPIPIFEAAFEKLSTQWGKALDRLATAQALVPPDKQVHYQELQRIAHAAYCHFRSTYLQIRFVHLRDHHPLNQLRQEAPAILREEESLALALRKLMAQDSRIGYEASNHYYYTRATLLEKVLNCRWISEQLFGM